jgi:hypothetical protein
MAQNMEILLLFYYYTLKECVTYNVLVKISDKLCTLTIDKVPKDKKVSVREAVKAVSIAGGQGVKACGCTSGNCNVGKCVCFNNKVPCNSRCHKGNPNPNCLRKHEPELPESQATTSNINMLIRNVNNVNKKSIFKK